MNDVQVKCKKCGEFIQGKVTFYFDHGEIEFDKHECKNKSIRPDCPYCNVASLIGSINKNKKYGNETVCNNCKRTVYLNNDYEIIKV